MIEFELKGHEFIPLNSLLKLLNLVLSGGEANQRIADGDVKVNDAVETQKRKKLRAGDKVMFQKTTIHIQ
jgi:ribosome-associated protein